MAGIFGWLLLNILDSLVVGILTLGLLLLLTGLHHTDGLLDFGDGLMYQGSPEKKIEIMHDQQTGTGGLALGLVTILATALCIAQLNQDFIVQSLIVSEVSAKLSMVLIAWAGRSARKGMNTYFIDAMHGQHRNIRLMTALLIAFSIAVALLRIIGVFALITGLITGLIMVWFSNRHFKGITGDMMGAANELVRMVSLIMVLAAIKWA
jgi:adenosylcobinamide-GDP ribazoletransferase